MNKTLVCIDMANLHYYLKKKQWKVNWDKFKDYLSGLYGEVIFIFYEGIRCQPHFMARNVWATYQDYNNAVKEKEDFFRRLKKKGFKVRTKYTSYFYDLKKEQGKPKCNFDVEITIDALSKMNEYERFVLCSGDGDFLRLIKYLNGKHKKTVLVYPIDRTSDSLIHSTNDKSFTLGSIRKYIENIP